MKNALTELLESEILGEDVKLALQEAFDSKVKQAETELQETYAARYQHDKAVLVEAMNTMLSEAVKKEVEDFHKDKRSLSEQRVKLTKETLKNKRHYENKIRKQTAILNEFVVRQLKSEIGSFVKDRNQLVLERKNMSKKLQVMESNQKNQMSEKINKLETFVLQQLSEELTAFEAEKTALVEQRVKMLAEGREKIQESQKSFIQRATQTLDKTLNEVIRKELTQWRSDIRAARENNFGRRIFEAVAAEYMASYLSEGSEIKKLQKQLQESKREINKAKQQVLEKTQLVESAKHAELQARDKARRLETLTELTAPLSREKKTIMVEMLKNTRTGDLKEAFNRYLPAVVNGPATNTGPRELIENVQTRTVATGNRSQRLVESNTEDQNIQKEVAEILHLAGLNNQVREN